MAGEDKGPKDVWDKFQAAAGLLTFASSLLVAGVGWYFTQTFKSTEERVAELQASEKMIGHLQGGDRETEAALALMSSLSRPEVAAAMARLYGGKGAIAAMQRLATNAQTNSGRAAAREALEALTAQSTFEEAKAAASALSAVATQHTSQPAEQIVVVSSGPRSSGSGKDWRPMV